MDLTPFHGPPAAAPHVPGFVARTLLGFGTHGEVWLADDLSTGGAVALKVGRRAPEDPAAASGDPPDRPPDQETALLCRIDHPHIVRLQRVVPLPAGGIAMVLDLASGGSLASLVAARGRFDPGEVSTLLVPLADALEHLHRRGVVHGDIAPGNVLFTGEGRPQLGDLGAAQVLGTRNADVWATPGFTDPALARIDAEEIDLRAADLWGLAAVGWFALTGRPPEPAAVAGLVTDRAPALGKLLTQCLTAAPGDRPSLHELADRAWQAARPTPVRLVTVRDPELEDTGLPPLSTRVTRRVPVTSGALLGADVPATDRKDAGPGSGSGAAAEPSLDLLARPDGRSGVDSGRPGGTGRRGADGPVGDRDRIGVPRIRDGLRGAGVRSDGGGNGPGESRQTRFRGTVARRRGVLALLSAGTAVAAVGLAVTVRPGPAAETGPRSPGRVPGGSSSVSSDGSVSVAAAGNPTDVVSLAATPADRTDPAPAAPGPGAPAALEAELTRALIAIGRSRAEAFGRASARFLAGADVAGSPAHGDDVRLVQRLRSRGYRLQGLRYEVSGVRILRRRGELVDIRAVVTTSEHRQVRIGSGIGVPVPADGPRPIILTVAPIDRNVPGPTRWRVRSVQVPS